MYKLNLVDFRNQAEPEDVWKGSSNTFLYQMKDRNKISLVDQADNTLLSPSDVTQCQVKTKRTLVDKRETHMKDSLLYKCIICRAKFEEEKHFEHCQMIHKQ
jgi:hypothetical protein